MVVFKTDVKKNAYIFVIENECVPDIITRLRIIFNRRRISVLDFQSVWLNDGDKDAHFDYRQRIERKYSEIIQPYGTSGRRDERKCF